MLEQKKPMRPISTRINAVPFAKNNIAIDARAAIMQLIMNFLPDTFARSTVPINAPTVLQMKYTLEAKPAAVTSCPSHSIKSFGPMVFVPTSIPTMQNIPKKRSRIDDFLNNPIVEPNEETTAVSVSLSILVAHNHEPEIMVMAANIGNRYFQLPNVVAANAAIMGPQKDETAFTTWPAVSELVRFLPLTTFVRRGFSET